MIDHKDIANWRFPIANRHLPKAELVFKSAIGNQKSEMRKAHPSRFFG